MAKRIVTVMVAVLVAAGLGVGGVWVASRNGQREPAVLTGLQVQGDQSVPSAEIAANAQVAPQRSRSGAATDATPQVPPGTVRYQVRGTLPELPRTAKAWTLDERASTAAVADLASRLGLSGQPRQEELGWTVSEGTRTLRVSKVPGLPWTFGTFRSICGGPMPGGRLAAKDLACATTEPGVRAVPPARNTPGADGAAGKASSTGSAGRARAAGSGSSAGSTGNTGSVDFGGAAGKAGNAGAVGSGGAAANAGSGISPSPSSPVRVVPAEPVQLPDRATAERIARDLLGRAGARLDGVELLLTRGFDRWFALASPSVDGLPTSGFSWSVGVGAKGQVLSASGWLATPRAGDTYPLITMQQALDRLRQRPVFGPITVTGPPQPLPSPVRPECRRSDEAKGCAPARAPSTVTVTVTDVRLGLQLASVLPQSGSGQRVNYLVPAYFFQLDGSWDHKATVVAVQDRFLTTPTPTAVPLRTR